MSAPRINYVRSPQSPIFATDDRSIEVYRVAKDGIFLTYWYALEPLCKEGEPRGEPFIDVRTLPSFDPAEDKRISSRPINGSLSSPAATRRINDERHYHANCFAAAVGAGLDLAQFAKSEREKLLIEIRQERIERERAERERMERYRDQNIDAADQIPF